MLTRILEDFEVREDWTEERRAERLSFTFRGRVGGGRAGGFEREVERGRNSRK